MLHVTNYRFKEHMTKAEMKALLEAFSAIGNAPGTTAHYVWTDGRGGTIVGETGDLTATYRNLLNYTEWIEFDQRVALPVEEAVAQVMDYVG
jgi:hypothetical protein